MVEGRVEEVRDREEEVGKGWGRGKDKSGRGK